VLNDQSIATLKSGLRGEVLTAGDAGYDQARKLYNGMIDRKPRVIVRVADVADVITCVKFAAAEKVLLSVKGGGHNGGGLGLCDDGLAIDLSHLRYVRVDPKNKTVRVGGGTTWGEVDHATHAFGLAVPAGIISTTGVGGLTLGGGVGHLSRNCGLTIDNLLEADVVLADGRLVTADRKNNSDLFWALRGGGGNFGVVTSFLFKCHDIHTDIAGPILYPLEEATEMMKWYREFIPKAPKELTGFWAFLTVPPGPPFPAHLHNKPMCGVVWCYSGNPKKADKIFKPIRAFKKAALDLVGPLPHPVVQSLFDALLPPGLQWYWKADFFKTLSDEAVAAFVKHGSKMPSALSTMHLYPIDGAAARVKSADTPWAYRDALWAGVIVGIDPSPANKDKITNWAREYWDAVHPFGAGGAYVNFMMEEGDDRVRATYGKNYARLAKIKKKYDPKNVFRVNQNIRPA
jgi:FAD/FMN-containing dehydrogenase